MTSEQITISLSKNEALVLFEFLSNLDKQETAGIFSDQSEQKVLWNIETFLETQLPEPFSSDYAEIIKKARYSVRNES